MPTFLSCVAGVLVVMHVASCLIVIWRRQRRDPDVADCPFITLLRPVCGLDRHDERTLRSSFDLDWPAYEIIFCAARADDPAVPVVRRLIAEHPHASARLLIGEDRISGNPKLNNLAKGWQAAGADRVVMADANLLLPRSYFRQLLQVESEGCGLVSSPPIGTEPEGLWAEVEAAFLNGNQARLQLAADELGYGFAQGKTLMWHRSFLDQVGGLGRLGQTMAEDVAATRVVRAHGLRVRLSREPFAQPIGRRSLRAVWSRQLRWSKVRREGFPLLFLLEPLNGPLVPMTLAAVAGGPEAAAGLAAVFYTAELALSRASGWSTGVMALPAMVLRDLTLPVLWAASFTGQSFEWRGTVVSREPESARDPASYQPAETADAGA